MSEFYRLTYKWNEAHAHSIPLTEHLPFAENTHIKCLACGSDNAFKIVAQIRIGATHWERAEPVYCSNCKEFTLPSRYKDESITAVNARLWSAKPTFLNIEPTTQCNFKCWYCVGRHMKQEDIKIENFIKVLDNIP